ncbi:MAG: hypothetical protein TYPL_0520 [Candidatus Tyloplasma litorale]|nr:MAG: hypothetical protein TYPL_0520 [Mycoplasmatales bacterium]
MYNKLNIKKFANKFNFNLIEDSLCDYEEETIDVFQAARMSHITKTKFGNYIAIIRLGSNIEKIKESINRIKMIIICETSSLKKRDLKKFLELKKPLLTTKFSKREVSSIVDSYLLRKQQIPERIHGTLISVYGEGVLIAGKSGVGKSELALELINRKHLFIGDDAIDIISFAGKPFGRAPKISRDFIEVRGVGIINVKGMFGIQSLVKEHSIDLIVELVQLEEVKSSVERLGREYLKKEIKGIEIPLIQIPLSNGRSIASVLEAAVIAFKQRMNDNYIAVNDFTQRLKNAKKN